MNNTKTKKKLRIFFVLFLKQSLLYYRLFCSVLLVQHIHIVLVCAIFFARSRSYIMHEIKIAIGFFAQTVFIDYQFGARCSVWFDFVVCECLRSSLRSYQVTIHSQFNSVYDTFALFLRGVALYFGFHFVVAWFQTPIISSCAFFRIVYLFHKYIRLFVSHHKMHMDVY